jgi:xylan 1,4-beta-xylosidase
MNRELVNSAGIVPMRLAELQNPNIGRGWRDDTLILLFVMSGSANVFIGNTISEVSEDNIVVISPNTIYEIRSSECTALLLAIGLRSLGEQAGELRFDCNSSRAKNGDRFYTLKHLMAKLLKENTGGTGQNEYLNTSIAFTILSELKKKFLSKKPAARLDGRQKSVISYINAHCGEGVTLKGLANSLNYSVPYFSGFFKKSFGIDFTSYYNSLRLERAVSELMQTDNTIEAVARNNGFSDVRSFVSLFKKEYGMRPGEYRKAAPHGVKKMGGGRRV